VNERLRLFCNFKIEGEIVKKLLIIVLGIAAFGLKADMEYMDVIKMELTGNCSVAEIALIKGSFRSNWKSRLSFRKAIIR
jgi:hypothetical protein